MISRGAVEGAPYQYAAGALPSYLAGDAKQLAQRPQGMGSQIRYHKLTAAKTRVGLHIRTDTVPICKIDNGTACAAGTLT